jgi:hypothetical protein
VYARNGAQFHNIEAITAFETAYKEWKKIAAHPWLFQRPSASVLFYGLHNHLGQLLTSMSDKTNKIALLRFSYPWQIMLQNQIYTLVKFGQVYNYIVMVGDEKSLQLCFELNLPCFNGTKYYRTFYKGVDPTIDALSTDKQHYKPMNWFKLRFYRDVLVKNYTILAFDTDIAFSRKNIWLSLEKYSADVGNCDMIFMQESPVNAGFFYSKSNPDTITLFKAWVNTEYTHSNLTEQESFGALRGYYYEICNTTHECNIIKQRKMPTLFKKSTQIDRRNTVTVRIFPSPYTIFGGICPANKTLDPCFHTSIYVHPICTVGQKLKIETLRQNGFWMIQDFCDKNITHFSVKNNRLEMINVYQCKPKVFEDSLSEKEFEKCQNDIAWTK